MNANLSLSCSSIESESRRLADKQDWLKFFLITISLSRLSYETIKCLDNLNTKYVFHIQLNNFQDIVNALNNRFYQRYSYIVHCSLAITLCATLGFFHEQARPDRDKYVKIYWHNILDGKKCSRCSTVTC